MIYVCVTISYQILKTFVGVLTLIYCKYVGSDRRDDFETTHTVLTKLSSLCFFFYCCVSALRHSLSSRLGVNWLSVSFLTVKLKTCIFPDVLNAEVICCMSDWVTCVWNTGFVLKHLWLKTYRWWTTILGKRYTHHSLHVGHVRRC